MRLGERNVMIMRRISFTASLVAVFSIYLSGCNWLYPPASPGEVLFQDDFSRTSSGWDRYEDDVYRADYQDGEYCIEIFTPETIAWSLPKLSFQDIWISVEAVRAKGPEDNAFGVICRYENPGNFIFFLISSDGYAGIGRYVDGEKRLLSDESLLPTDAVHKGNEGNFIQAECIGDRLTLFVNNSRVAEAVVEDINSGDVGLITGTYADPDVEIRFDNFSTVQP
jgi:hypothetical protein